MNNTLSTLNILLYDKPIATLTHLGQDKTLFALTEDYINNPDRPTLSLNFKDAYGQLITGFNVTQTQVLPFLSNLLPEAAMRTYLAKRAGVHSDREFFLLWVLGRDLPGAVTIVPANGEPHPSNLSPKTDEEHSYEKPMRFSLAGVQLKFSAIQEASGGLTIPVTGEGGDWIVKLPSSRFESVPENEYAMMTLAKMLGMDVPKTKLIPIDQIANLPKGITRFGDTAFAIQRFDRTEKGAVHIEDFAQIFGVYPKDKYQKASLRNLAQVLNSESEQKDMEEFIRRVVFNTLIGNADMHLKNWSVIYRDQRTASLAPAYDFVSTVAYIPDEKSALKVSRSKAFKEFTYDELSHLASKARLPEKMVLDTAKQTVEGFYEVWEKEKRHLSLSQHIIEAIDLHLKQVPMR